MFVRILRCTAEIESNLFPSPTRLSYPDRRQRRHQQEIIAGLYNDWFIRLRIPCDIARAARFSSLARTQGNTSTVVVEEQQVRPPFRAPTTVTPTYLVTLAL